MNFSAVKSKFKRSSASSGKSKEFIAKLSKGLMLPIAMLPIAGLFLGIGASIATAGINAGNEGLTIFGNFLKIPGDVIFGALPVLFAIAIAIAFTKDAGPAALAAFVGFLVFSGIQQALIVEVHTGAYVDGAWDAGAGDIMGYNLLFYLPGSMGIYSPTITQSGHEVNAGLQTALFGKVLGINQLSTSVFGGFIVGFTVAFLYNKFKDIQLPAVVGFFSGIRFIPIAVFFAFFPITLLVLMVWPLVGILFGIIGEGLGSNMVGFNSFIFGYIERALVPFGLHHAFYSPLWYTSVGGSLELGANAQIMYQGKLTPISEINGQSVTTWNDLFKAMDDKFALTGVIAGDQVLWANINNVAGAKVSLEGVSDPHTLTFSDFTFAEGTKGVNVGQYMQGKYPFMMFGLPAAGAAMVMAAPKENRKMSASIVGSAAITSLLTGITEPIEFTFLFLAPWLFWGVHAFFCALSFGLMNWIGLMIPSLAPHIGMTFSGGLIDWVVYGAIQIPGGSNAWWALIFGAAYAPIYFFMFSFLIKKFDIATPGRGGNDKLFTKADYKNKEGDGAAAGAAGDFDGQAIEVIKAYGGLSNIKNVDACITKLRIQVGSQDQVDENRLKNDLGAMGTIKPSNDSLYSIYGAKADFLKNKINEIIAAVQKDPSLEEQLFSGNAANNLTENQFDNSNNEATTNIDESFTIYAPVDCEIVNMSEVPDETFSQNIMGSGIAIKPLKTEFSSILENGQLESFFDGGHAYIFKTPKGSGVLMHIGVDSVNVADDKGKKVSVFKPQIKANTDINLDSNIVKIGLTNLKKYAKSDLTPIIVLNETLGNREIKLATDKTTVKKGEPILIVE